MGTLSTPTGEKKATTRTQAPKAKRANYNTNHLYRKLGIPSCPKLPRSTMGSHQLLLRTQSQDCTYWIAVVTQCGILRDSCWRHKRVNGSFGHYLSRNRPPPLLLFLVKSLIPCHWLHVRSLQSLLDDNITSAIGDHLPEHLH